MNTFVSIRQRIISAQAVVAIVCLVIAGVVLSHAEPASADGPETVSSSTGLLPTPSNNTDHAKVAQAAAEHAAIKTVAAGGMTPMSGYGNRLLEQSGWNPLNANAYHWFYTNIYTWDTWLPPTENGRVTSGDAQPPWLGTTPYNPYLLQLTTTWTCSGITISVQVVAISGSFSSGSSGGVAWAPVYSNWQPNFYYPYDTFSCKGFEVSTIAQRDAAQVQLYSNQVPYLVAINDSEGVGAF